MAQCLQTMCNFLTINKTSAFSLVFTAACHNVIFLNVKFPLFSIDSVIRNHCMKNQLWTVTLHWTNKTKTSFHLDSQRPLLMQDNHKELVLRCCGVSSEGVKYLQMYWAEAKALNNDLMHSAEAASHPSNGSFFTWHLGSLKINWEGSVLSIAILYTDPDQWGILHCKPPQPQSRCCCSKSGSHVQLHNKLKCITNYAQFGSLPFAPFCASIF